MEAPLFQLDAATFRSLSKSTQDELLGKLLGKGRPMVTSIARPEQDVDAPCANLTSREAREYLSRINDKHAAFIRALTFADSPLTLAEIQQQMGETNINISTLLSAATRRVRTVLGDKTAYLVDYEEFLIPPAEIDYRYWLNDETKAAFAKSLGTS